MLKNNLKNVIFEIRILVFMSEFSLNVILLNWQLCVLILKIEKNLCRFKNNIITSKIKCHQICILKL